VIALSSRWLDITSAKQAMIVSAVARTQRMPLMPHAAKPTAADGATA